MFWHCRNWELQEILIELRKITRRLEHPRITHLTLQEIFMTPIAPGSSPVYTATPQPTGSVPATRPTWTSSDTTNATVTVDATGLIATVAIPATAVVGTSFTLSVSYTNADGTIATGSLTQTIVAAASPDIESFVIEQTA